MLALALLHTLLSSRAAKLALLLLPHFVEIFVVFILQEIISLFQLLSNVIFLGIHWRHEVAGSKIHLFYIVGPPPSQLLHKHIIPRILQMLRLNHFRPRTQRLPVSLVQGGHLVGVRLLGAGEGLEGVWMVEVGRCGGVVLGA